MGDGCSIAVNAGTAYKVVVMTEILKMKPKTLLDRSLNF